MERQLSLFDDKQHGKPFDTYGTDGVPIIKGVIYTPKGPALEYAPLATNPYKGCGHSCAYCSVPHTTHQDRGEFNAGAVLRPNYIAALRKDAAKYQAAKITEQVLIAFITDPYCTLTKGGTRALRDLDLLAALARKENTGA
jgi:DNA repair photolyase